MKIPPILCCGFYLYSLGTEDSTSTLAPDSVQSQPTLGPAVGRQTRPVVNRKLPQIQRPNWTGK